MNQKNFLVMTLMVIVLAATNLALAQNPSLPKNDAAKSAITNDDSKQSPDDFIDLLRKDVRSQKKQIIAENMDLSDAEAEKFWPVYDRYAAEALQNLRHENCPTERLCPELQQHDW